MGARPRERGASRSVGGHGFAAPAVKRRHLVVLPLGFALVFLPGSTSSAEGPVVEAAEGASGYYWSPSSAQTTPGGTVTFKSPSGTVPHGVTWAGGPTTPACAGVPIDEGKTSWNGSCTFAQAGTYAFTCPVHPVEMSGNITVASTGTTPDPAPLPPGAPDSTPGGPALKSLKLARSQRGTAIRGVAELSRSAAGGALRVELRATRVSLLGPGHPGAARVGKLVRSSLRAGMLPFTVSLNGTAREALRQDGRLRLTVSITIKPIGGPDVSRTRSVVLHG